MFYTYLRTAIRNLLKNKRYAALNILGLAIGMASAVLILIWVQNELSFDQHHTKANDLYRLKTDMKISESETWHWSATPLRFADHLRKDVPEIKAVSLIKVSYGEFAVQANQAAFLETSCVFVDPNWFKLFDYPLVSGSFADFARNQFSVAITESKARKYFGDQNPIGKIIQHDTLNFTVAAVLKDLPASTGFRYELFMQNAARLTNAEIRENDQRWGNFNYQTFVQLQAGTSTPKLGQKLTRMLKKLRDEKENATTLFVQPLSEIHFDTTISDDSLLHGDKQVTYIFGLIALLILLVACINCVNLTTAQSSQRAKEVGIKKVIGASKLSLFGQFFTEAVLTSLLSLLLALGFTQAMLPLLESTTQTQFTLLNNPAVWQVFGCIALLSVVLTGIYPALLLTRFEPLQVMKGITLLGYCNVYLRKILVVFQFAFTIFLLICTAIIFNQLRYIQTRNLGYDKAHVLRISVPWNIPVKSKDTFASAFASQLKRESSIADITFSNANIIDNRNTTSGNLDWDGRDSDWNPSTGQLTVAPNFQSFFNLRMVEGRWFNAANKADEQNVVLNETAVRTFRIKKPFIGQRFEINGKKGQIIGIAKDFHFRSPKEKLTPLVLRLDDGWVSSVYVKPTPTRVHESIASVEKVWNALVPARPVQYEFLDESYQQLHRREQMQLQLFFAFSGVVLFIACLGLFGLATFAARARTKEIGIRKVLGASVAQLVALLSKDFLRLVVVAFILAVPVAWYVMHQWMEDFAYRVSISWWIFAAVGVLAVLVALLTVSIQAIKAALANPVKSLRSE